MRRGLLHSALFALTIVAATSIAGLSILSRADAQGSKTVAKAECKREWTYARDEAAWKKIQSQLNKPSPELSVGPWIGTTPGKISDLKGKIVLIDFWATWCGPCRKAVPEMNKIMKKYEDKGVVVLGVCNTREGKGGPMAKSAKDLNMQYPTASDSNDASSKAFGVQWWPYVIIIDREGTVRMAGLNMDSVDDALDALIAEQPSPISE